VAGQQPDNASTVMWVLIVILLIPPMTPIGLVLMVIVVLHEMSHPQR